MQLNKEMFLERKFHLQGEDHWIRVHLVGAALASDIRRGKQWRKYSPDLTLSSFKPSTGITS